MSVKLRIMETKLSKVIERRRRARTYLEALLKQEENLATMIQEEKLKCRQYEQELDNDYEGQHG